MSGGEGRVRDWRPRLPISSFKPTQSFSSGLWAKSLEVWRHVNDGFCPLGMCRPRAETYLSAKPRTCRVISEPSESEPRAASAGREGHYL